MMMFLPRLGSVVVACVCAVLSLNQARAQDASGSSAERVGTVTVRFVDSATGADIRPYELRVRSQGQGPDRQLGLATPGGAEVAVGPGRHTLHAGAKGYQPVSGDFEAAPGSKYRIRFILDPVEEPLETRPEHLDAIRRHGYMLVQGFVVADDSGDLLPGTKVTAHASGQSTITDERGFFRLQLAAGAVPTATALSVEKPGYTTQLLKRVDLWSAGDVTYRLRLQRGDGAVVADEPKPDAADSAPAQAPASDIAMPEPPAAAQSEPGVEDPQEATLPANATVRVPRNIRVLNSDQVTIDYVSMTYYTRAVLGSEWIASWGGYTGGSNSLNAGAVAVRCYAISRINNASPTSNYDICGTSSCQVYNPAKIHSYTDTAVYYTADWVLVSNGAIAGTEYSAENNSLDVDGISTFSCPDGFTAPTGACLYDPVCAGQDRFGHGRGMCQWGSARWATGRRMNNRASGDATPNGYPRRDWKWILQHYYPNLTLLKGAALVTGDDVRATRTVDVRACPGGEITNGTSCPLITTRAAGQAGVIVGGPFTAMADGRGFTWYRVQWNDASATTGWTVENHLERVYPTPTPPPGLAATAVSSSSINLAWTDTSNVEAGFNIERAPGAAGPWLPLTTLPANSTSYSDTGLLPGNTWYYRVNTYNSGGVTPWTAPASATTPQVPPAITAPATATVPEMQPLARIITATVPDKIVRLADFDSFKSETANGVVLFRIPRFSGSTSGYLESAPNVATVTDAFPAGLGLGRVLRAQFAFTSATDAWLRLTTGGATYLPNPVIPLNAQLRFRVYSDRAIRLAIGCRETSTAAGTPIGSDGGGSGPIEWVGVSNAPGATTPVPTRTIPAATWTTVTFNLATEPVRSFSLGDNVLSTASGLGVLEHLAIVPAAGAGVYNVYLDTFEVVEPRSVVWSLEPGNPAGAAIHANTGELTWTPSEAQGPGTYVLGIVAADSGSPTLRATNRWTVNVMEQNLAPVLAPLSGSSFHTYPGATLTLTNTATDPDLPQNTLTFSLDAGAPAGAAVDPVTGIFTWTPGEPDAGNTSTVTVRVTDNGVPPLSDMLAFSVTVRPLPKIEATQPGPGQFELSFETVPGITYVVQYKTDLAEPGWLELTRFTATSTIGSFTNDAGAASRFYRIAVQ